MSRGTCPCVCVFATNRTVVKRTRLLQIVGFEASQSRQANLTPILEIGIRDSHTNGDNSHVSYFTT
jgi:hypothetical protein